jgi:hypothetical protein
MSRGLGPGIRKWRGGSFNQQGKRQMLTQQSRQHSEMIGFHPHLVHTEIVTGSATRGDGVWLGTRKLVQPDCPISIF